MLCSHVTSHQEQKDRKTVGNSGDRIAYSPAVSEYDFAVEALLLQSMQFICNLIDVNCKNNAIIELNASTAVLL